MTVDLGVLAIELRQFAQERDWEQFHSPKNLAMALAGEVGELVAEFQWLTPEDAEATNLDEVKRTAIEDEVADVLIYLIRLSDRLDIDLDAAVTRKLELNRSRYTIDRSYGCASKIE